MAEQEMLTPMVASYLLNVEKIRVAPTLNGADVIRIEPPLVMTKEQIRRIGEAVHRAVETLAQRNTAMFLGHLVGYEADKNNSLETKVSGNVKTEPQADDGRFAFLVHPLDLQSYTDFDASLKRLSGAQLEDLASRWNDMVEPFVISETRITAKDGRSAYGEFICVPKTAEQLLELGREEAITEIMKAVELGAQRGAKLVGLGAYTSVVTMGRTFASALYKRSPYHRQQLYRCLWRGGSAGSCQTSRVGIEPSDRRCSWCRRCNWEGLIPAAGGGSARTHFGW